MDSSLSSLHLAMAALVGASFMAISAFYIHKRAVDQVLDRLIQIRRKQPHNSHYHLVEQQQQEEDEEEYEREDNSEAGFGSDEDAIIEQRSRVSRSLDDSVLRRYRISSSMPNFAFGNDWLEEDAKFDEAVRVRAQKCSASSLDKLNTIPSGLAPLQMTQRLGDDQSVNRFGSSARLASVGRLLTPRSPGANAFENAEDSDEDGTELANEDDVATDFVNDVRSDIQNSSAATFVELL